MREKEQLRVIAQEKYDALAASSTAKYNELFREFDVISKKLKEYEAKNPSIYVFERKMSDGDNPNLHMIVRERDTYLCTTTKMTDAGDGSKMLVKFTTKTTSDDYTHFNLHAIIYGASGHIMEYLLGKESLYTSERAMTYCRYFEVDETEDIIEDLREDCQGIDIAYQ